MSIYKIGITGSYGTGKSTVGEILTKLGFPVIETDNIVQDLLKTKNYLTQNIVKEFGDTVLNNESSYFINKSALAELVFNDETKRKKLESLIHPVVRKSVSELISINSEKPLIFVLIPLLFESGLEHLYDESWCVICDEKIQIERLENKGISKEKAYLRILSQLPQSEKSKRSTFVINNSGTVNETKNQILDRLNLLAQSNHNLHLFLNTQC